MPSARVSRGSPPKNPHCLHRPLQVPRKSPPRGRQAPQPPRMRAPPPGPRANPSAARRHRHRNRWRSGGDPGWRLRPQTPISLKARRRGHTCASCEQYGNAPLRLAFKNRRSRGGTPLVGGPGGKAPRSFFARSPWLICPPTFAPPPARTR